MLDQCTNGSSELGSCGPAPELLGITSWFNTPDDGPLALADLRGEVVLVDFWAYSCINCQRSIPHVVAWDEKYGDLGLTVIGVHSPEYAFEKEERNVRVGADALGIDYAVALDNSLSTWTTYRNRYWPAHYLIDADGTVRHIRFGEGGYATPEALIRALPVAANPDGVLPPPSDPADETPDAGSTTPETYLSLGKMVNLAGAEEYASGVNDYRFPATQPSDTFTLDGAWDLGFQNATPAGDPASIRLAFTAREVRMVLGGEGTVTVSLDGRTTTFEVSGTPNSYPLVPFGDARSGTLEVTLDPGVDAYSFTFG